MLRECHCTLDRKRASQLPAAVMTMNSVTSLTRGYLARFTNKYGDVAVGPLLVVVILVIVFDTDRPNFSFLSVFDLPRPKVHCAVFILHDNVRVRD